MYIGKCVCVELSVCVEGVCARVFTSRVDR